MKRFDSGVQYYTSGTVSIPFPEDDICCIYCPLMAVEYKENRKYCRRTGEYLPAAEYAVSINCPIEFSDNRKEATT